MGIASKKLSQSELISIARSLFKVTSEDPGKNELIGLCPLHDDKNPSFNYNYQKDVFNCFAGCGSGDLIELWSKIKGYNKEDGFKQFCKEYKIPLDKPKTQKEPKKQTSADIKKAFDLFPPLPEAWIKRLYETKKWNPEIIKKLDIRLQTHYADKNTGKLIKLHKPERVAIPIFDKSGELKNIRLYKPKAKKHKIISWGKGFGTSRLFPATPFESDKPILLTEGESDTICALSYGFNAITQTSKLKTWTKADINIFKNKDVIIAYDADVPGQKYAKFAAENLFHIAKSVRMLLWPEYMGRLENGEWPKDKGQDLSDFFIKHNKTTKDFEDLFTTAKPFEVEKDPLLPSGVDSARQFFAKNLSGRFTFKPRLLAERILDDMSLMADPENGLMYKWNGKFWELYPEEHIESLCLKYLGDESQKNRAKDATYQIKTLSTLPSDREINDKTEWIATNNCMLNIKTLETAAHDKDYYNTFCLSVDYDPDSTDKCEKWLKFLQEDVQTPEVIMQLQEFAGYCLTRDTRFAKCLILVGPGSDGKSVFLKILRKLVGTENSSAVSFQELEDQFIRTSIYGKLLNISTEVGSRALESQYFKAIVTGDPISGAFKFQNAFPFTPFCKLAFATNKMPRVLDNSEGFFRRLLPVQFKVQYLQNNPDTDPFLEEKLEAEISEIFHWALIGLHRLLDNNKFTDSDETDSLMLNYRRLNNPVLCFIEDVCHLDPTASVQKDEIYKQYKSYCSEYGYNKLSRDNFIRELYSSKNSLTQYRPNIDGRRENRIKGITIDSIYTI